MDKEINGPELASESGETKQLIVLLHGLGADGRDLIGLAPEFADTFPDAHFISPNAPSPCDMAPYGYQWFSLQDRNPDVMHAGAKQAAPVLNAFLDAQLARFGLSDDKMALIGFSQGTMMSLYTALRRPREVAGILGYSGALLGGDVLEKEIHSRPHVCLVHGTSDMVVPFAALEHAESVLELYDVPVEAHARPGLGHNLDQEGIAIGIDFLSRRFGV